MIAQRLLDIRKIFKPNSASAFAKDLGISQTTYSNYENGSRSIPDAIYVKLQNEYNVNLNWLICGKGEMFLPVSNKTEKQIKTEKKLKELKTFGSRLNYLMAENDLSPEYLEKDTKISAKRITKMIMDEEKPTLDELRTLKKYFNVSIDLLLDGDEDIKPVLSEEERKILEVFKKAKDNNLI